MRVEVTIDKTKPLPAGALDALSGELSKRINKQFSDRENKIQVRYAGQIACPFWVAQKLTVTLSRKFFRKPGKALMTGSQIRTMSNPMKSLKSHSLFTPYL